jgi:hypothetical protein
MRKKIYLESIIELPLAGMINTLDYIALVRDMSIWLALRAIQRCAIILDRIVL